MRFQIVDTFADERFAGNPAAVVPVDEFPPVDVMQGMAGWIALPTTAFVVPAAPAEYRVRWSLRAEHPLTAPAYSERRSALAKQLGLGRHRQGGAATESEKPKARTKTKTPPTRRGRRRSSPPT